MAQARLEGLAPAYVTGPATLPRRKRVKFYVALSVLMTVLVGAGFWPSYYGPLIRSGVETSAILHFHGVIYVGWFALLISQAILAAKGRIRAHRSVGTVGIGYGVVVWGVGVLVSFVAPMAHVNTGEWTIDQAAAFLPIPLGDKVLFGGFFAAAVAYRRKPEIHKGLMLLATVAIVFAAAFRLQAAGVPMTAAIALWFVPVLLGIAYDAATRGRVHPVYWIGVTAMAFALLRLPFGNSEAWLQIGRPLFEALT
jgi:hypothetical protein